MLAVPGNDGELFAVLPKSIELVGEGRLKLLACDVGELCLGYERLGLGPDKLLLQHYDSRRIRILIFELGDLVSDLLLACDLESVIWRGIPGTAQRRNYFVWLELGWE